MCFRHRLLGVQVFAPYRGIFKPPLEVVVMTDGKVGVGFCPQKAFGSAVGVILRLVEGVACSLREQALASAVIA